VPSTSQRRVAIVLAVPVILITVAVFVTAQVQRSAALQDSERQVASQSLLTAMLDQETGARGYFQTGRPAFLAPWTQGTANFTATMAELRRLFVGDRSAQRLLAEQAHRAAVWHHATQQAVAALRRTGRNQSPVQARQGKHRMDGFRNAHAAFDRVLSTQRSGRLSEATVISVAVAALLALVLVGLGLAITRRMARREADRQRDQSELRELLQVSESEEESRGLLIRHIEKTLPGARATVFNRNNSDDRLEITSNDGKAGPLLGDLDAADLRPRSCLAVRLTRPYDHEPGDDALLRCAICGDVSSTTACEPLLVGGQVIGSVLVVSPRRMDDDQRDRVRESVTQATPILANQRNLKLAEARAASDALTGLPNRRAADETLKRMAVHAGRSASPLAAILLDLDHFKILNDRYGHESGDKALAVVGRIITAVLRASDFAARFGGEEFLILLPDTDHVGALLVAEKLRSEIEHAELVGIGPISASLGVAVLPVDAVEPDELLRKADRALYTAKESGRNRVHSFSTASTQAERRQTRDAEPDDAYASSATIDAAVAAPPASAGTR
jgi:diguanylate cyclase (GGDEF)-like protein